MQGNTPTPNLLDELTAIAELARRAQQDVRDGQAVTGTSALRKIEERADDAVRHHERMTTRR